MCAHFLLICSASSYSRFSNVCRKSSFSLCVCLYLSLTHSFLILVLRFFMNKALYCQTFDSYANFGLGTAWLMLMLMSYVEHNKFLLHFDCIGYFFFLCCCCCLCVLLMLYDVKKGKERNSFFLHLDFYCIYCFLPVLLLKNLLQLILFCSFFLLFSHFFSFFSLYNCLIYSRWIQIEQ